MSSHRQTVLDFFSIQTEPHYVYRKTVVTIFSIFYPLYSWGKKPLIWLWLQDNRNIETSFEDEISVDSLYKVKEWMKEIEIF